ncbi:GNAT family N-acetyltransferase [Listeria booriae]|uniref:GNAT family N-acetyltransferase n=1 Tax=Listeria booriae TaxID=1552123 RepID=A0A7X0WEU1_9LIST|nr:GNAT family N-acetyltransferase [Listeria booriae]MBC1332204.1 GNAT family N-acetyltransferase [Listeria booriae]
MSKNKIVLSDTTLTMREASVSDGGSLQQLMIDTATWLKESGSTQWGDILEGKDVHQLRDRIRDGEVFVLCDADEQLAAAFILRKTASEWDAGLWRNQKQVPARYLHRLMIARKYAGQNLSLTLLDWASGESQRTGYDWLRLDCIASNQKLNTLYQVAGFTKSETVDGFCIYEKRTKE